MDVMVVRRLLLKLTSILAGPCDEDEGDVWRNISAKLATTCSALKIMKRNNVRNLRLTL